MAECPGKHCSSIGEQINEICKSDGFRGDVVYVMHEDVYCYCKCSCVAVDTLVAVAGNQWKRMGDIRVGDSVLALDSNNYWTETTVKFSSGTGEGDGNTVPYAIFLVLNNGTNLIVTADHPFLLSDDSLQVACRLSLSDKLTDENLNPVEITHVGFGEYVGGIHNISTSVGPEGEGIEGHLINTGGIISGDYYAQLYLVPDTNLDQPLIGMPQYYNKHGISVNEVQGSIELTSDHDSRFVPYRNFLVPKQSVSFLPDWMAQTEARFLRPLDDTTPLEIAKYLVTHFEKSYPDITYHIYWADNAVNAYAWMERETRHVAILGGLIRHNAVGIAGLGLVIAHEIAHHYGGPPKYSDNPWASCEGQADYWGAMVAMREVWWGEEALEQIKSGAEQLYKMFSSGLISNLSEAEINQLYLSSKCSHPPANCRRETYLATLELDMKPACAG